MMAGTLIISGFRTSRHTHCPALLPSYHLNSLLRGLRTSHAFCSRPRRYPKIMEVARRRIHQDSTDKGKSSTKAVGKSKHHDHELSDSHSHSHSHGIFGGHSHSHDHDHDHGGGLIETLQSGGAHHSSVTSVVEDAPSSFRFPFPLPDPSSLSVKVIEVVASRLLDWAQILS